MNLVGFFLLFIGVISASIYVFFISASIDYMFSLFTTFLVFQLFCTAPGIILIYCGNPSNNVENQAQIKCNQCNALILEATAKQSGGICMPCKASMFKQGRKEQNIS